MIDKTGIKGVGQKDKLIWRLYLCVTVFLCPKQGDNN